MALAGARDCGRGCERLVVLAKSLLVATFAILLANLLAVVVLTRRPETVRPLVPRYLPAVEYDPEGPCLGRGGEAGQFTYSQDTKRVFICNEKGAWEPVPLEQ
jgi:hypothetical protein